MSDSKNVLPSKPIPVGEDDQSEKDFYDQGGGLKAKCRSFTASKKEFTAIEITHNDPGFGTDGFHILRVDHIDCSAASDGDTSCHEIHIKGMNGQPNKETYKLKGGACDRDNVQIYLFYFTDSEIANGDHTVVKCRAKYPGANDKPDVKKGNIIVGN